MSPVSLRLGLAALLLAGMASAEPSQSHGTRLSFMRGQGASSCITAQSIEREVVRRMGRDPFGGRARQWIEGVVEQQSGAYEVQLIERDADGNSIGSRRLHESAGDCRRLDDAIVLAIALIIDPTAQLAPADTSVRTISNDVRSTEPARDAMTSTEANQREPNGERGDPAARRADPAARRADLATADPPPSCNSPASAQAENAKQTARRTAVSADTVAVHGVMPTTAIGAEFTTRLALERSHHYSLRLSALFLPEARPGEASADLGYGLTAIETGACAGIPGNRIGWFNCLGFGAGAVHTVVHSPLPHDPGDRMWMAFRFETGLTARIVGPLQLQARLFDLLAPRRWDFRVLGGPTPTSVFTQSFWMPGAALGVGLAI